MQLICNSGLQRANPIFVPSHNKIFSVPMMLMEITLMFNIFEAENSAQEKVRPNSLSLN